MECMRQGAMILSKLRDIEALIDILAREIARLGTVRSPKSKRNNRKIVRQ